MRQFSLSARIWLALVLVVVGFVVAFHRVDRSDADPRGTLLVAESIVTHGTIRLDHYGETTLGAYANVTHEKNGHRYHYFPLGTPLLSVPFVALARLAGLDMVRDERATQTAIVFFVALVTVVLMVRLASSFLDPLNAVAIAAVFWLGTSLASTTATALWSHDFASLFALLGICLAVDVVKSDRGGRWPWIGICLFLAYLCRPTLALLAPFLLLFVGARNWRAALGSAMTLGMLLVLLMTYSRTEFGQWLPDYYLPQRLDGGTFWRALFANLASPSRGLLVFSPFILTVWLCRSAATPSLGMSRAWLLIGLAWPVIHLVAISRFPHWWGGASYGARLMTDALPGLFLLTIRAWPVRARTFLERLATVVLVLSCAFAVYVNAYKGVFVEATAVWNQRPAIDAHPELIFDWRYPQFLHNWRRHEARIAEYE